MWHIFPRGPHRNGVSKTRFLTPINRTNSEQTPKHQRKTQRKKKEKRKKRKPETERERRLRSETQVRAAWPETDQRPRLARAPCRM